MELSIIIPIYNTDEDKLIRCFESIKKIDTLDFECLLIDDGSVEKTSRFCQQYAQSKKFFRYFRKENGGVSSARNMGIQLARGSYICFVDSDDEIEPSVFDLQIMADGSDLIFTDLEIVQNKKATRWYAFQSTGNISFETAVERISLDGNINGPYCKFIKHDFILNTGVCFNENMINGEDAVFFMQLLEHRPKMFYHSIVSYYYHYSFQSGSSRLLKYPEQCINDVWIMFDHALQCISVGNYTAEQRHALIARRKNMVVHSLFGFALDSVRLRIMTPELQNQIAHVINHAGVENNKYAPITKLRLFCLKSKKKIVLYCMAYLRAFYLKIKSYF